MTFIEKLSMGLIINRIDTTDLLKNSHYLLIVTPCLIEVKRKKPQKQIQGQESFIVKLLLLDPVLKATRWC